ncbi:hypothetical protein [Emticicia sp. BO119]|uniref:hypothetical protein n=1 Tax=Emticicia sp. BO119 TaxID=2757768 RepID=UPI0015F0DFC5|nr:hypothetical protein [Emticicia sp. BO119]MBA4849134.1 hypothetical protein [Emticicia sp. BO119]
MNLSQSELPDTQPRRTLVAVDLGEFSEKVISYLFLLTRDILSEYTIFHCLEGTIDEKQAREKIDKILVQARNYLNKSVKSSIKIHIAHNDLLEELQLLHAKENFGTVFTGATNKPDSWRLGPNAQAIMMNISAGIVIVPPNVDLSFPSNISILVEKVQKSSFSFLHTFHEFVSHYGIFLNFVLFAKDKQELEEERRLIEEYQDFFDSTITFNFIVEQEQTHINFLRYIEGIHCEAAVMAWHETTTAFLSAKQTGIIYCSPKLPILYIKKKTIPDKDQVLFKEI